MSGTDTQSRLRAAERRRREVEQRYALATSAALEGIYEWDLESGTVFLTERAKSVFAARVALVKTNATGTT